MDWTEGWIVLDFWRREELKLKRSLTRKQKLDTKWQLLGTCQYREAVSGAIIHTGMIV